MIKTITFMCAASFVALAPSTVAASETVQKTVRTADLNLANSEGREALDRRIRRAALSICGDNYVTGSRIPLDKSTCTEEAIASTRDQVATLLNASRQNIASAERPFAMPTR